MAESECSGRTLSSDEWSSATAKVKWQPFQRFLRRNKHKAKYPDSESEATNGNNTEADKSDDSFQTCQEIQFVPNVFDGVFDQKTVYDYMYKYMGLFSDAVQIENPRENPEWRKFWTENLTADFIMVRPSENPLDLRGSMKQLDLGEIRNYQEDIVTVDCIKILGDAAVIVYRSETRFLYKGEKVEDYRTNTVVLLWQDGRPKITSIQRSAGQDINATR